MIMMMAIGLWYQSMLSCVLFFNENLIVMNFSKTVYVIFLFFLSHSPNFALKRCAPASIRLVDNAQFQFGKYVDLLGLISVSKDFDF